MGVYVRFHFRFAPNMTLKAIHRFNSRLNDEGINVIPSDLHPSTFCVEKESPCFVPKWIAESGGELVEVSLRATNLAPGVTYGLVPGNYCHQYIRATARVIIETGDHDWLSGLIEVRGLTLESVQQFYDLVLSEQGATLALKDRHGKSQKELDEERRKLFELEREVLQRRAVDREYKNG